jgi:lysylphosphatidylglycerol synthetase-like protein (DUF2156 family)
MSDYGAYPPPPPSEGYGQAVTPAEPPPAIKTSVNIVWAVVALVVLGTILTLLSLDDIVDSVGTDLTSDERDAARTGAIVGAIVALVIFGGLWTVLAIFLRRGANWARIVLTVLAALGLVLGLLTLGGNLPAVLLVIRLVQMALYVALIVFMWRPESSQYIAGQRAR